LPKGFNNGEPIPDYHPTGSVYADSISTPFSDLRCIGIKSGHFIPEEQPDLLSDSLLGFLNKP
jgi:hypothetical protein